METNNDTPRASPKLGADAGSEDVEAKTSPDNAIQNLQEENPAVVGGPEISQTGPGGPAGDGGADSPQSMEPGPGQTAEATEVSRADELGGGTGQEGPPKGGDRKVGGEKARSQAQKEASRRNGRHSNGPRTAEGKARVRLNALKHGILSDEVLVTQGEAKEDIDQYEALYRKMIERFHPRDVLEELEVKKIIAATWRLGRLLRFEAGAIRMQGDTLTFQDQIAELREYDQWGNEIMGTKFVDLYSSKVKMYFTINHLSDVRKDVEAGNIPVDEVRNLIKKFPTYTKFPRQFLKLWEEFNRAKKGNPAGVQGETGQVTIEGAKEELLRCLDEEMSALKGEYYKLKEKSRLELEAKLEMARIPDEAVTNRIIRYGSYLEGIIVRSMATLERLQSKNGNNGSRQGKGGGPEKPKNYQTNPRKRESACVSHDG